ncbi:hypothetical protein [Lachnobacterium bovis]|uniref:hypothetical protein n=1 Tax=Lachnobacterium bovis TaxID=140626 RepID=UPI00048F8CB4|nr:hypothetical protein [Lachnobacterium bovis]
MKNKTSDWNVGYGMLFPEDFDDPDNPDDEENIGENNICFFQAQTMRITKPDNRGLSRLDQAVGKEKALDILMENFNIESLSSDQKANNCFCKIICYRW